MPRRCGYAPEPENCRPAGVGPGSSPPCEVACRPAPLATQERVDLRKSIARVSSTRPSPHRARLPRALAVLRRRRCLANPGACPMSASSVPVSRRQFLAGTAASCLVPATSLAEEPRPANRGGETTAVSGTRGAVATVHPLASQAALQTLQAGGNAADAAVAAALMLAVVDGHNSGLGGGCFILARAPDGQILAIDGREMAPAAAHRQMFFQGGEPVPARSQVGPLANGVPGAVAAYHALSQRLGTGRWSQAVAGAAEVPAAGVPVSAAMAARLAGVQESIRRFPATAQLFLRPDGAPLQAGDRLVQTDLARTLRELAAGP